MVSSVSDDFAKTATLRQAAITSSKHAARSLEAARRTLEDRAEAVSKAREDWTAAVIKLRDANREVFVKETEEAFHK